MSTAGKEDASTTSQLDRVYEYIEAALHLAERAYDSLPEGHELHQARVSIRGIHACLTEAWRDIGERCTG